MDMANTCLARAKSEPLSIKLKCSRDDDDDDDDDDDEQQDKKEDKQCSHPIIAVLLGRAHRWYNLNLAFEISHLVYEKLLRSRSHLSRLYRLEVNYTLSSITRQATIYGSFPTSPALRILHLYNTWGLGWHETGNMPLLPWRQFQHLSFKGTFGDCLAILQLSPNLRVFKANMTNSPHWDQWNLVHHTSLRELNIETDHDHMMLEALTLPALVSLSYSCGPSELSTEDVFLSFLTRSEIGNSLETFSLTFAAHTYSYGIRDNMKSITSMAIVINYLQHIPNLTQLSLCDLSKSRYADAGQMFSENTIASTCRSFCWKSVTERDENQEQAYPLGDVLPKLKRFSITGPHTMNCVWVAGMVMTRWRDAEELKATAWGIKNRTEKPARLESVEINYKEACGHAKSSLTPVRKHTPAGERALARLRLYRSEGLRVVGNIVDEVECIECVDEEIVLWGLQPDSDF